MAHVEAELGRLERELDTLDQSLSRLVERRSVKELIRIIKHPGWTTPAEFALVMAAVGSLQHQVNAVAEFQQKLVAAAERVGRG